MRKDGNLISLDSTHKTCVYSHKKFCYLYTIVARCEVTGKGKPLAWMFTNSDSQYPIRYWLEWLKNEHQYVPATIMIDNSDTEIAAINNTYNQIAVEEIAEEEASATLEVSIYNPNIVEDEDDDADSSADEEDECIQLEEETPKFSNNVTILLCYWHILKAWKKNILGKVIPKTSNPKKTIMERKQKRDEALEVLTNLMIAATPAEFRLRWDDLKMWSQDNNEEWESVALYEYMRDNYYGKRRKWSAAFRRVKYNLKLIVFTIS